MRSPPAAPGRAAPGVRARRLAALILAALVSIIALTEFFTRRTANRVQAESDAHQAELAQLNQKHNAAIQLDRKRKELEAKVQTIKVLERQRKGPVHVLDDLGAATPDTLWLTEMRESGGMVTLLGRGLDNQTIALFMRNLSASPYFANVDLVETKQVEEGQAKLKEFSIRANVLYGGRAMPTPAPAADAPGAAPVPQATAADGQPKAQEAVAPDSAPGVFAAPGAARQAAKISDARNAGQDAAAAAVAGEPHS